MRAVGVTAPGVIENLQIISREIPSLKESECLLKVYYSAINRADTLQRKGHYPPPSGESDILGLEAVGRIHTLPSNSKWKKNDRVYYRRKTYTNTNNEKRFYWFQHKRNKE